jgi:hypothetical protein
MAHEKLHGLNSTLDHIGVSGTEDNFMVLDSNGLPKDSGYSPSDFTSGADYLKKDGTVQLTGDWDYGSQTISGSGDVYVGELSIKVFSQAAEPNLTGNNHLAIWIDTDNSNAVYLVFRRGSGDQVAVELA